MPIMAQQSYKSMDCCNNKLSDESTKTGNVIPHSKVRIFSFALLLIFHYFIYWCEQIKIKLYDNHLLIQKAQ